MTMMTPDTWVIPCWHQDFGDPIVEVEMLRIFCRRAIRRFPQISTKLSAPEDGYLNVDVIVGNNKIAEIHIIPKNGDKQFGLFCFEGEKETKEVYFTEHEKGLRELEEMLA